MTGDIMRWNSFSFFWDKFTWLTFALIPPFSENISLLARSNALSMYVNPRLCGSPWIFRFTLTALSCAPMNSLKGSWTDASVLYSTRATCVPVSDTSNSSTNRSRNVLNRWKFLLLILPEIREEQKTVNLCYNRVTISFQITGVLWVEQRPIQFRSDGSFTALVVLIVM